ncbi:MAG: potassium/proton antiporter [Alcanivoracaceae bacterium]|nr:potassium/proton antiporter [Alcanivoracaceae bacterium]
MDALNLTLLIGASLLFVGLLLGSLSLRFGVPSLLVFLLVGMAAGEDGIGGIQFDDFELAYLVSNIALAIILLDGGLRTRLSTFRVGLKPALTLATLGVALSAGLVGAFATWLMDLDWRIGLLLGGIIGSTDAAAVFNLIKGTGVTLNERVASTLEVESGLNDPMAIFITVLLIEVITTPGFGLGQESLLALVQQFGVGALLGAGLGTLLAELLLRVRSKEGLHALLLCAGGACVFAVTNTLGGSGFLAVYLAGLIAGNRRGGAGDDLLQSMDSMAWLAQSGMFLLLGLLVTPSTLGVHGREAIIIALFLMFIARPLAVWLCLLPFHFDWREKLFVSWTGLRGAVPIVLAMFPLLAGISETRLLFDVTLIVVLASLLLQGSTMGLLARALRVSLPLLPKPLQVSAWQGGGHLHLVQFVVEPGARADGKTLASLAVGEARPLLILRGEEQLQDGASLVNAGDHVAWLAPLDEEPSLAALCQTVTPSIKRFYGDFTMRGDVHVSDLAAAYGFQFDDNGIGRLTLDALFRRRIGQPVVGDALRIGGLRLRVRSMDGERVDQVGIRLPRD